MRKTPIRVALSLSLAALVVVGAVHHPTILKSLLQPSRDRAQIAFATGRPHIPSRSKSLRDEVWKEFAIVSGEMDLDFEGYLGSMHNKCDLGLLQDPAICHPSADRVRALNTTSISFEAAVRPVELPLQLQGAGSSLLSTVLYNDAASDFIKKSFAPGKDVGVFPEGSMVLKLIWAPAESQPPIGYWDPTTLAPLAATYEASPGSGLRLDSPVVAGSHWPPLKIDTRAGLACDETALHADSQSKTVVVPLSCFYHREVPCIQIAAISTNDTFVPLYCKRGASSGKVILMGFHMAIADASSKPTGWNWATFWWTPFPHGDKVFHTGNSARATSPGRFFSMNATRTDVTPGDSANFVFNPYLEGVQVHGVFSNCVHCHTMAGVPKSGAVAELFHDGHPARGCYASGNTQTGDCSPVTYWPGNAALKAKTAVTTRFLWSLANAGAPGGTGSGALVQHGVSVSK